MHRQLKRKIGIVALTAIFSLNSIAAPALAATTADNNADAANRPTITEQNNVPVVDIVSPNANGISHNKYLDFNVDKKGLILNNALTITNTQLAGNIAGNANLGSRSATIILNEVTGMNPTRIGGFIEVAGQRADVVVANPNGISGSGFGFINADRASLVTGTPFYFGDKLRFDVTGGQVEINGTGLDDKYQPNNFEILSRAVKVNAEVWAQKEINVITGSSKIDYETLDAQFAKASEQETKPAVALDIGAIGGMYSGKIKLIGTEQGMGVNILGEIDAQETALLDSQGKISLAGKIGGDDFIAGAITAVEDIKIKTTGDIENNGKISSQKNIAITSDNLANNGMMLAGEAPSIEGANDEEIKYLPAEEAELRITASGKISGLGAYSASKNIRLAGQDVSYIASNVSTPKLFVNGTEKNLDPISGEPPWPDDTTNAKDPSDPMNNKNNDGSTLIDLTARDVTTIADSQEDNLPITADTSIAAGARPIADKTASGIDLIQITGPDSNGVSRNYFTDFNVNPNGLILNNSIIYKDTQLGGYIANNPILGRPAATILNEVTSGNISKLYGFIEVAGPRANVLIANHNGINVNGLGFINAFGASLRSNNYLKISGGGLNAAQTDRLNLSGGSIYNDKAEIWSNNLSIDTSARLTNQGRIVAMADMNLTGSSVSNEQAGFIYSQGNVSADVDSFTNQENSSVIVDGNLDIKANEISNKDSIIFSGQDMRLTGSDINNTHNALINAYADINITATGKVLNQSSNIESEKSITIAADELVNEKEVFKTDWTKRQENIAYSIPHLQQPNYYSATRGFLRKISTGTIVEETDTAKIFAADDIGVDANKVTNHYSYISAGNDLTINASSVENHGYQSTMILDDVGYDYHYWRYKKHRRMHIGCKMVCGQTLIPYTDWTEVDLRSSRYGVLSAGDTVSINAASIANKTFNAAGTELEFRAGDIEPTTTRVPENVITGKFAVTDKKVTLNSDPEAKYLAETNSRFTDYKTFLSSDYLLERIKSDPTKVMKRIGDGYYEQKLVTNQILDLTGKRFLGGYTSEMEQFKALMDNGAVYAQKFGLAPGAALSKEQMAVLTSDIVWLTEEEVNGEKVLVPFVYLSKLREKDLTASGAVIVGNDINLFAADTLTNIGTIKASKTLEIKADQSIINKNGTLKAQDVNLEAVHDIANIGGLITGTDIDLKAENILSQTTTRDAEIGELTQTTINQTAGIAAEGNISLQAKNKILSGGAVISAGKHLDLSGQDIKITSAAEEKRVAVVQGESSASLYEKIHAGSLLSGENITITAKQIDIKGSDIAADNSISMTAQNEINISADKDVSLSDVSVGRRGGSYFGRQMENHEAVSASQVAAGGNISVASGTDTTIKGSAVQSETGKLVLSGENISISAETEDHETIIEKQEKSSGILSGKSSKLYDSQQAENAAGSSVYGDSIDITSAKDTTITASTVIAANDVNLSAGEDISIQSAEEESRRQYQNEVKKSGLMSGGIGFSIGSEQHKLKQTSTNKEQAGSLVGSVGGNVAIDADKSMTVSASSVKASGDIRIEGDDVNIVHADNVYTGHQQQESKKSGLTVSLGGQIADAVNNVIQPLERAGQVSDDRLKTMYGVKAAESARKAAADINKTQKAIDNLSQKITDKKLAGDELAASQKDLKDKQDALLSVNIGFGTSKSSSTTESITKITQGTNITADADVAITSREKDLTIKGSNIEGENVTLTAAEDVNILAAATTNGTNTDSKSSSGSIGVTVGLGGGVGGFFSASKSKGEIIEDGVTWNESIVDAKDSLTMASGKDANIIGGQVSGDTVKAEIGGDLNIESLQDSENYREKNVGGSFGVSVAPGSHDVSASGGVSKQNIDSKFSSVRDQAGISAGDGGFDIVVGGNTDLKGAIISSDADAEKNKISTDTLTFGDIENKAEYSSSRVGANLGLGNVEEKDKGLTPNIGVRAEGDASSTTHSAISDGTLEIRGDQKQDINTLSRDTTNSLNALGKIFDKKKVQEQQELAALFGEEAFKLVHKVSKQNGWKDGSAEKIALHAFVGGVMSELGGNDFASGAVGAGLNELVMNQLKKIGDPALHQWASLIVGGAAAAVIGGDVQTGASVAASGTKNNFYAFSTIPEEKFKDKLKKAFGGNEELADEVYGELKEALHNTEDRYPTLAEEKENIEKVRSILNSKGIKGEQADQIVAYYAINAVDFLNKSEEDQKTGLKFTLDTAVTGGMLALGVGEVKALYDMGKISYSTYRLGTAGVKPGVTGAESNVFKSQNLLESHYLKHGSEMQKVFGERSYSITKYLEDANFVIKNGTYVPELNGYVRFVEGQKYGFVGLDRATGNITTFHIKTVSELMKNAPSLGLGK